MKITKEQKIEALIDLRDYRDSISRQIKKISEQGIYIYTNATRYFKGDMVWIDDEDVVKEMKDTTKELIIGILKKELRSVRAKIGKIKIN
jgi:hypothetical protein